MTKPTEFTLISAKSGGWLVYVDKTNGRPDFAGSLDQCCRYVKQQTGEQEIDFSALTSAPFPIPQRD